MSGLVLLIDADPGSRESIAGALLERGFAVIAAASGREALERLAARGARPDAILLDPYAPGLERTSFVEHLSSNVLVNRVPVIVLSDHPAGAAISAAASARVPRTIALPDLVQLLTALCRGEPPPPPARLATGTGSLPADDGSRDLHAYAEAKLAQYLGASRAHATLEAVLREARIDRIITTAELHRVAEALRLHGSLEAAVAALLSGRATLIDSDRTLRRR